MRKIARGRIVAVISGAPSRPHVILEADAVWRLPPRPDAWILRPAAILPLSVRVTMNPPLPVIDDIGSKALDRLRHGSPENVSMLVIEETASPSMTAAAMSKYSSAFRDGIYGVRLLNGSGPERPYGASTTLPVNTLSSLFHSNLETRGPDYLIDNVGGAPAPADVDMFAVSFSSYAPDTSGDVMGLGQLQSALSSAEELRTVGKPEGEAFEAIGNPKEALAASLMLSAWAALERGPSTHVGMLSRYPQSGLGEGPLRRRVAYA